MPEGFPRKDSRSREKGGMGASIYNAMPVEGVEKLADFIRAFDKNN